MNISNISWRILRNLATPEYRRIYLRQVREYAGFVRSEFLKLLYWSKTTEGIHLGRRPDRVLTEATDQYNLSCLIFKAGLPPDREQGDSSGLPLLVEAAEMIAQAAEPNPNEAVLRQRFKRFAAARPDLADLFIVTRAPEAARLPAGDYICWWTCLEGKEAYFAIRPDLLFREEAARTIAVVPVRPSNLSRSQRLAVGKLERFYAMKRRERRVAGVAARPIPLIVGPSGSGKTHVVGEFARRNGLPVFDCNFGTWSVTGSRNENSTLRQIRDFVRNHDRGAVFIDEVDKLQGDGDWARCLTQEIYALLDGRMGSFDEWTDEDRGRFKERFFLIGAGTWQNLFEETGRTVGFRNGVEEQTTRIDLTRQKQIEPELLYRFNADVIFLEPPGPEEFREKISNIRKELHLPPLSSSQLEKLVEKAVASHRHHRFLEAYVSHLLAQEKRQEELALDL